MLPFETKPDDVHYRVSFAESDVAKHGTDAARSFQVDDSAQDSETRRTKASAYARSASLDRGIPTAAGGALTCSRSD